MAFSSTDETLAIAREKFRKGELSSALSLLSQIVAKPDAPAEAFQIIGTIFYEKGQFTKAIKTFKRALKIDPHFTDALVGLSIIYNDLGKYEEGAQLFERVQALKKKGSPREISPQKKNKLSELHSQAGDIYFQIGQYSTGIKQFELAMNWSEDKKPLQVKKAYGHFKAGRLQESLKITENLLAENPRYIPGLLLQSEVYLKLGLEPQAKNLWEKVLAEDPNNNKALKFIRSTQGTELTL